MVNEPISANLNSSEQVDSTLITQEQADILAQNELGLINTLIDAIGIENFEKSLLEKYNYSVITNPNLNTKVLFPELFTTLSLVALNRIERANRVINIKAITTDNCILIDTFNQIRVNLINCATDEAIKCLLIGTSNFPPSQYPNAFYEKYTYILIRNTYEQALKHIFSDISIFEGKEYAIANILGYRLDELDSRPNDTTSTQPSQVHITSQRVNLLTRIGQYIRNSNLGVAWKNANNATEAGFEKALANAGLDYSDWNILGLKTGGIKTWLARQDYFVVQFLNEITNGRINIANQNGFSGVRLETREDYAVPAGIFAAVTLPALLSGTAALQGYTLYRITRSFIKSIGMINSVRTNRQANAMQPSNIRNRLIEFGQIAKSPQFVFTAIGTQILQLISPSVGTLLVLGAEGINRNLKANTIYNEFTNEAQTSRQKFVGALAGMRFGSVSVGLVHLVGTVHRFAGNTGEYLNQLHLTSESNINMPQEQQASPTGTSTPRPSPTHAPTFTPLPPTATPLVPTYDAGLIATNEAHTISPTDTPEADILPTSPAQNIPQVTPNSNSTPLSSNFTSGTGGDNIGVFPDQQPTSQPAINPINNPNGISLNENRLIINTTNVETIISQTQTLQYVVRPGDTLVSIAERYGLGSSWKSLAPFNADIQDPDNIHPGDIIKIPIIDQDNEILLSEENLRAVEIIDGKPVVPAMASPNQIDAFNPNLQDRTVMVFPELN